MQSYMVVDEQAAGGGEAVLCRPEAVAHAYSSDDAQQSDEPECHSSLAQGAFALAWLSSDSEGALLRA